MALKDLTTEVEKRINEQTRTGNITKDAVEQMFDVSLNVHKQINGCFSQMDGAFNKTLRDRMENLKSNKECTSIQCYYKLVNSLSPKLKRMEETKLFSSFIEINNKFIKCLEDLMKNFDTYIDIETLALPKAKLSHYLIMGLSEKSDVVCQFFQFLLSGIIYDIVLSLKDAPKYRTVFLEKSFKDVATYMDDIDKIGSNSQPIKTMVDNLKKNNNNVVVVSNTGENLTAYLQSKNINPSTLDNTIKGSKRLRVFGRIGEAWETFRYYWIVRRTKVNKEWMLNQISLLKDELEGMDENDPNYQRLVKAVENYSVKISQYDARVQKYMEED